MHGFLPPILVETSGNKYFADLLHHNVEAKCQMSRNKSTNKNPRELITFSKTHINK